MIYLLTSFSDVAMFVCLKMDKCLLSIFSFNFKAYAAEDSYLKGKCLVYFYIQYFYFDNEIDR